MANEDEGAEAPKGSEKTFTQADLDRILADRLKRESAKYADYDDLKAKAEKFAELEDKDKSEAAKLADKLTKAESKAAEAEAKALRFEVAADKGIPATLLTGLTREEMESNADALIAFKGDEAAADGDGDEPQRRPQERLKPGATPSSEPDPDIRSIVDSIEPAY